MSFAEKFKKLKERFEHYKAGATEVVPKLTRTLVVTSAAAAGGIVEGRFAEKATVKVPLVGRVPMVAIAGVFLNVADYFGVAGEHSAQLGNAGDGLLASVAQSAGFHFGQKWAAGHLGAGVPTAATLPAPTTPAKITGEVSPEMVAHIADQVRQTINQAR